ncbi:MAG: gamma-glutamyl-gamma-aminobutyrate hydrolase family protein [Pseudomonadota bacterium]
MARPLIGIIGNAYTIDDSYPVQSAGMHNLEAVARLTGAIPMIVPSIPEFHTTDELLSHFSGFVFTGGRPNVHPEEYGEEPTEAHGQFDRDRDRVVLPLIRAAVERGTPILGICRGFQEFNVAFGGSLHPEIRDLPGRDNHRMPPDGTIEEKFALRHDISLIDGSVFRDIFGAPVVRTNSLHGQGIKEPGARISIEGYAPDGTPEAIRVLNAKGYALAVQWHPEYKADEDPVSKPLFESFGRAVHHGQALAA